MTDILSRLAELTAKDEASPVPACPVCGSLKGSSKHDDGRQWWHCDICDATGPTLSRYSDEDEPCWKLIAAQSDTSRIPISGPGPRR